MALSLAAAALGSAGIGAGGSILGSFLQARNDRKMLDRQNAYNIDMWNMNNAYNDPASQIERLKAAGLNPNLMYGTGHAATGNSSSAPSQTAFVSHALSDSVNAAAGSVSQAIDNYLNYKQRLQNYENSEASNDNLREQNRILQEQRGLVEAQRKRAELENKVIAHDVEVITGKGGVSSKSPFANTYNAVRGVWNAEKDHVNSELKDLYREIEAAEKKRAASDPVFKGFYGL